MVWDADDENYVLVCAPATMGRQRVRRLSAGEISPVRYDYTELGLLSILDGGLNTTGRTSRLPVKMRSGSATHSVTSGHRANKVKFCKGPRFPG